jgi:hypothetical protein
MEESPRRIESQSNRMTPFPFDAIALTDDQTPWLWNNQSNLKQPLKRLVYLVFDCFSSLNSLPLSAIIKDGEDLSCDVQGLRLCNNRA